MSTDIHQFLKPAAAISKYAPYDETPEETAAATELEKASWREIYSFAHAQNRAGNDIDPAMIRQLCDRFYIEAARVTAAFSRIYERNKDEHGIDDKPDIYKVENFLKKNWNFAINEVLQRPEFSDKKTGQYLKLNVDSIYRKLQHVGFKYSLDKLKSLLKSDFMKRYNPFVEYFYSLEPWDGVTDHISELANYITAVDQEFFTSQFKKMLVRSVGCAVYGVENRFVFVFVGEEQEKGKSTFIRFLNPFGKSYISESPIRDNPTTYFSFAENFMHNIEELMSVSNVEVNQLKAIISLTGVKERKPYAIDAEEQPRRTNFWGSTNKGEFLTDTANSRWLCFVISDINWNYKSEIDIHKAWAQAFALWNDPEYSAALSAEEAAYRDKVNKGFEVNDLEKDLIKQVFEVGTPSDEFFSNPQLVSELSLHWAGKPLNTRFIAKHMTQLGFIKAVKKINGHTMRGFYAKRHTGAQYQDGGDIPNITPAPGIEPEQQRKLF